MLMLDLVRLEREGSLRLQAAIPADDPLWEHSRLRLGTALEVDLRADRMVHGEILVRGTLRGSLSQQCRRCLASVQAPVDAEVSILLADTDGLGQEADGDVVPLDPAAAQVDLGDAVREELLLSAPAYVECREECRGLCPGCGIDLNVETCQCVTEDADPRWDALRALKTD